MNKLYEHIPVPDAHWSKDVPRRTSTITLARRRRLLESSPARIARPPVQERRPREPLLTACAPRPQSPRRVFWAPVQIRVFIGARVREGTPLANSRFARASAGLITRSICRGDAPQDQARANANRRRQASAALRIYDGAYTGGYWSAERAAALAASIVAGSSRKRARSPSPAAMDMCMACAPDTDDGYDGDLDAMDTS